MLGDKKDMIDGRALGLSVKEVTKGINHGKVKEGSLQGSGAFQAPC
jgi:hypothetical protein